MADGNEFKAESRRFCQLHDGYALEFRKQWPGKRRRMTEQFLRSAPGPIDTLAIFGHGGRHRLHCTGHARRHIPALADALKASLNPAGATIVLYACLTGRGWGWADELDVALEARGLNVDTIAHTTSGHTTWNPYAEYSGEGPRSCGVEMIPRGHPLRLEWVRRLRDDQDFRLSFWQWTQVELETRLARGEN
jgi:hypothetical protein